ncbi:MAG: hypothetical protein KUG77_21220 [Nannocystaceae bacterium]|nr:hypothetical protein [Nannocystaceae bacterium]
MVWRWRESWAVRAWFAASVATVVGVGVGWSNYFSLPGAMNIDWASIGPLVLAFGGLCALMLGLGLGGGMVLASRRDGAQTSAHRLCVGAMTGGLFAGTIPATLGIGGFAQLHAPYGGTANILGSCLLASAVFVALFAPLLHRERSVGLLGRLGLASVASCVTAATLGGLAWIFVRELALEPSFEEIAMLAQNVGLWSFSAYVGAGLAVSLGLFVGLATWVYLSLVLAVRRPS